MSVDVAHQRAAQAVQAANKTIKTRAAIVAALRRKPFTGATSAYVAAMTGLSKSAVNRALKIMADDGLVESHPNPFDRRVPRYTLTSKEGTR